MARSRGLTQLALLIGVIFPGAAVVYGKGTMLLADPTDPDASTTGGDRDLPSVDDLSIMGAVIVAEGGPVDSGVIEGRYVFDSGGAMPSPLDNPNPSHSVNFVFVASPRETLHMRWEGVFRVPGTRWDEVSQ